ncbi:MAG: helix-turn-helix domain-containing protein [Rhodocyclales bacterium]|jgi:excisionase family DNA binding protein|nr:helix-turn-helix domain-containing protein [Rhodocyclales bacterium]
MTTVMTVAEAAAFLKVSDDVLYPMLARGEIPAGKVKGQWRLIEDDLLNWLRSQYSMRARAPSDVEVLCHTEGKEPVTGGSLSKEYASLLGLPTSRTQKHSKGS